MRFSGKFSYPKFDAVKMKKALDEAIQVQMRQAAREWLRAILTAPLPRLHGQGGPSIGIPPVWTGTARGTLIPLGRYLRIAIPITPLVVRKGLGPEVGASKGKFAFDNTKNRYIFRFSTSLPYFNANEFSASNLNLTYQTPWHVLEVGKLAFNKYMNGPALTKLPKLQDFIKIESRIIK